MKYLFIHFTGEEKDGEQIYFSVSEDGLHWKDLNDGKLVVRSSIGERGVRDPFVVRDEKQNKFYMIATDLRIEAGKGWDVAQYDGSRDLIVWESEDLVYWSKEKSVTVGIPGAGCVWAPEGIYDEEKEAFFVFWASMVKLEQDQEAKQRIYASYTKDFTEFTEPFLYLETGNHVIDMNIVKENGWYYRFVKDETTKGVFMDKAKQLTGEAFERVKAGELDTMQGIEGPEAYPLPDGSWCVIVDQFAAQKGYLPLVCDSLKEANFKIAAEDSYHLGKTKKRHGCVLPVTDEEYNRLVSAYGR